MNTNAWKHVIIQKICDFPLAPFSCYHFQAELDLQLFDMSSVKDKSAESYNQDKFSNIIFQMVCQNLYFVMAKA